MTVSAVRRNSTRPRGAHRRIALVARAEDGKVGDVPDGMVVKAGTHHELLLWARGVKISLRRQDFEVGQHLRRAATDDTPL